MKGERNQILVVDRFDRSSSQRRPLGAQLPRTTLDCADIRAATNRTREGLIQSFVIDRAGQTTPDLRTNVSSFRSMSSCQ